MVAQLLDKGWVKFPAEPAVRDWAASARQVARERVKDADEQAKWLTCEGTWFVGVDTLPNDISGDAGGGPLTGEAYEAAQSLYGRLPLHRAQVSVVHPGYPRPREGESDAAFRYRLNRDAAHVDGLLATGPDRRRMLKERHAYILGLPLTECSAGAAPMTVWEGSHHLMRDAFTEALKDIPEPDWADADLTDIYKATRREVFATCRRITLPAKPGEAYLVHRLALHGVAPWQEGAIAPPDGRMIAYFRPELPEGNRDWLELP
ncbi:hypothetical protein A3731_06960 [Roseovarius sp. HI0049]|nr:hypothetical protein A3731_06960 [Roseovarius sp. HI0049]